MLANIFNFSETKSLDGSAKMVRPGRDILQYDLA